MLHPQEALHGAWQAFVQEVPEALGEEGPWLWRDARGGCRSSHGDDVSNLPDTRDPEKKKCLFCKSTEDAVHYTQPMASMLVDGKLWELRFEADGTYHWEAEGVTQEEKDAAMVDISSLAQSPSPSMDPSEASFADQVPQSLRIKLRDQVVTQAPDPALLEALAKRNERPHLKQEEDKNEGQKGFHP